MIKHRVRFLLVSLTVGVLLAGGSLLAVVDRQEEPEPDSFYKYLSVFTEVLGLVRQTYVEETDVDSLMEGAFEGAADALDAFSVYIPPADVPRYQAARQDQPPDTGLFLIRDRGWVYVSSVTDGSTAEQAGIEAGDLVAQVDDEPTRELQVWEIEALLAAKAGGEVQLELLRQGETVEVTLPVQATDTAPASLQEIDGVSLLRITQITSETEATVRDLLTSPEAPAGELLVDLRGVAGGDPQAAYDVAGLFASGPLGSLQSQGRVEREFVADQQPIWQGRLVVLADRTTLGAAELLVLVLKEGSGARLVGEATYGWAGRSDLIPLSSGGLLVLTGAFYAGPEGQILDGAIEPDLRVTIRDRTLAEKDLTLEELMLRRGIELLLEPELLDRVAA